MSTSIFIAQLLGPTLLVAGLGIMVNKDTYLAMAKNFLDNTGMIYLAGFMTLIAGLAITNTHNIWIMGWPVIITIIGWLAIVGGIFRMAFPNYVAEIGTSMMHKTGGLNMIAVFTGLLGAVLTWYGYMA